MRRTGPILLLLVAVALAGCLGGESGPVDAPDDASSGDDPASTAGNGTDPGDDATDEAGGTDHVHDLWKDRSTIDLVDGQVNLSAARADPTGDDPVAERVEPDSCDPDVTVSRCLGRATVRPPAADDDSRPNVVAPGTGTIRADVSWEAEAITGVEVAFVAGDGTEQTVGTLDEPGTVSLPASDVRENWTHFPLHWTDDGHAVRSSWVFVVTAAGAADAPDAAPQVAHGTVQLDVDAERAPGPLPDEPPHPDWYAGNATYLVGQREDETSREIEVWQTGTATLHVRIFPEFPVPPGTSAVLAAAKITDRTAGPDGTPLAPNVTVRYSLLAGEESGTADVVERTDERIVFRIPVQPRMTDSLYACTGAHSSWRFAAETAHGTAPAQDPVVGEPVGAHVFDGRVNVTVAATERLDVGWDDLEPVRPEVPGCKLVQDVFRRARPG